MSLFAKKSETPETPVEGFAALDTAAPTAEPAATATVTEAQKTLASELKTELKTQKIPTPVSMLDPATIGFVNQMVSAAVAEAVAEAVKGMAPMMLEISKASRLTRDELVTLSGRDVEKEKAFADRLLRERTEWKNQEADKVANLKKIQEACRHRDANERYSIGIIHNYPDRQPRAICVVCHKEFSPRHFVIDAPEPISGKERYHLEPESPEYSEIMKWAAAQGKL